uniref:Zinc finger and BTB domain containing 43 n=1 Tax=Sinocyclocheilus grahami TaxID=75366 RepID=A0A672K751_SINGR
METGANSFHVEFPDFSCSLLKKLNQQRQRGQLCDLIVSIGGHQFRAHRAVLAASSPYFCDQVLLKNSARVVLPDVMHPCVFEQLLLSCYTGGLSVPSGEVVSFLTAASFLQMWHVVDKCTELLEVGKKKRIDHGSSPKGDGYATDNEDAGQTAGIGEDLGDLDPALGPGMLESAGCSPAYVPPSIMGRRKKGFSQASDELSNPTSRDKLQLEGGADVSKDETPVDGGSKEQTSHSGFASVVYKLYPCQCGKSFTHKSQRDRHMSMHLGLRPFGCAVCGKSFKMKHHLVGHMKI